jgi:hypothetical protein
LCFNLKNKVDPEIYRQNEIYEDLFINSQEIAENLKYDFSVNIYNELFNEWFKNRNDESKIMEIADKLRIHRKKLIAIYFFDDDYDIKNFSKSSMG